MGKRESIVGTTLHDTYRIERLIDEGGMGAVYEASHLRLTRRFAIKVLMPQLADHGEALNRFKREADIIGKIGHPHIVEVIDYNHTEDGAPYMVMELLEGETLAARISREGPLPLEDSARIFMQAASAIESAHDKGVVHRDLKPQNLFLSRVGRRADFVKVVDFGISKVLTAASGLTRTNAVIGTPWYMAPEQVHEAAEVDHRADIWAMGAILYEMLAGSLAFPGTTAMAVLYKVVHEPPASLRSLRADLPPAVEECVLRALGKTREERYPSMLAFWEVLAAALRSAGVAVPETEEDRRTLWPRQEAGDEVEQPTQTTARAPAPLEEPTVPRDLIVGQPISRSDTDWEYVSTTPGPKHAAAARSARTLPEERMTGPLRPRAAERDIVGPRRLADRLATGPADERDITGPRRSAEAAVVRSPDGVDPLGVDPLEITGPPRRPAKRARAAASPAADGPEITGPPRQVAAPGHDQRETTASMRLRRPLLATDAPAKKETLLSGELQPRPARRTARFALLGVLAVLGIGGGFWVAAALIGKGSQPTGAGQPRVAEQDSGRQAVRALRVDARPHMTAARPDLRAAIARPAPDAGARASIERAGARPVRVRLKVRVPKKAAASAKRVVPAPAGTGSLGISALPSGKVVEVRFDGKFIGRSPQYLPKVEAGRHTIEAWLKGQRVDRQHKVVKANEENSVVLRVPTGR